MTKDKSGRDEPIGRAIVRSHRRCASREVGETPGAMARKRSAERYASRYNWPLRMRRPARTSRLSFAAIGSLLAFIVLAGAGARSLWTWDVFTDGNGRVIGLQQGCIIYEHSIATRPDAPSSHFSGSAKGIPVPKNFLGFAVENRVVHTQFGNDKVFGVRVPTWFPLLLLLLMPMCWLIARPANAPAFPVVTDTEEP